MENNIYNSHINIFDYYGGGKYHENNISRVLAKILLEGRYKKFHKELLEKIGVKGNIDYVFSHVGNNIIKHYINNSDKKINDFIPVCLTDIEIEGSIDSKSGQAKNPIPDIVLLVGDKLIYIEVKLNKTIPKNQVLNQIRSYTGNKKYYKEPIKINWSFIIKVLSKYYSTDFFISDYLQFIDYKYSHWFDFNFKEILEKMKHEKIIYDQYNKNDLINIRIYKLLLNYCNKNKLEIHPCFKNRSAFLLKNNFVSEMQYRFNKKDNSLEAHIWTGELVSYTKAFNDYYYSNKSLVDSFINDKTNEYGAEYSIVPYILFRDHFSYLNYFDIDSSKGRIIPREVSELLSKRMKYTDFKLLIEDNIDLIKKYIPNIYEYYEKIVDNSYKNTHRTNMTISVGYNIIISYPCSVYTKLDCDGKLDNIVDNSIEVFGKYFNVDIVKK